MILRIRDLNLELADALVAQGVSCSTLFDQSEAPEGAQKRWPKGLKRFAGCGYAGGLGPDNIYKQLSPILNAAQGAERWWVEMDSSLRTTQHEQEVFSLANCKRAIREFESSSGPYHLGGRLAGRDHCLSDIAFIRGSFLHGAGDVGFSRSVVTEAEDVM